MHFKYIFAAFDLFPFLAIVILIDPFDLLEEILTRNYSFIYNGSKFPPLMAINLTG